MVTVEEVARSVVASVATDAGYLLAARWVAERYRHLCSRGRLRHLRQVGTLTVPANVSAGTVTVARDDVVVVGDATARAAWTSDVVGRFIRLSVAWYEIDALTAAGDLHLAAPYAENDVTAGAYVIVARRLTLPDDAKWIGEAIVHARRRLPLDRLSITEMDLLWSARSVTTGGPGVWAELGVTAAGAKQIEVYPGTDTTEHLHFVYWPTPPLLGLRDPIPAVIDAYVLKEGALVDLMRYEMSKALQSGQMEVAATWRNDYRAQETQWERRILEAIRSDRGSDDITLILNTTHAGTRPARDVMTARDQVLLQWPR